MSRKYTYPNWVLDLMNRFMTGSSGFFILHGNVDDSMGGFSGSEYTVETLTDFLGLRLLNEYDLVLHYDVGRGTRIHPGGDDLRESQMRELLGRMWPGLTRLPQEPTPMLRLMDRLVSQIINDSQDGLFRKTAFIFDYAELLCPAEGKEPEHLATLLNWARNPKIRRLNMLFILMTGSLARLDPALVQSGFTTEIQVPMPEAEDRLRFIENGYPLWKDEAKRLTALSAGLSLANLDNLLRLSGRVETAESETSPNGERIIFPSPPKEIGPESGISEPISGKNNDSWAYLAKAKKELIEAQCPGLLEFVEPKLSLDLVAGHGAAKERLANDARLIREGRLEAVPMGYLLCGPVGVGKTFMAMCYAGSVGIPCVTLQNFRSKYVGETEANLEKILRVLRELGPVAVIIDEADAAVGDRGMSGDSGTSSRVFAQLAAQMGNTEYRGKTIWFLLTCRPDLLPVDLKRQGRCEEHIPLFYPQTAEDRADMFMAMGKKLKLPVNAENVPLTARDRELSGADIESLLTRVNREALLRDVEIDGPLIEEVLQDFRSPRSPEHELQILAAVLESSDLRYLPKTLREKVEIPDALAEMTIRFHQLKMGLQG